MNCSAANAYGAVWRIDRACLVDGSTEQIEAEVKKVVDGYGRTGFILGADCTLPTSLDHKRIKAAVDAAHKC